MLQMEKLRSWRARSQHFLRPVPASSGLKLGPSEGGAEYLLKKKRMRWRVFVFFTSSTWSRALFSTRDSSVSIFCVYFLCERNVATELLSFGIDDGVRVMEYIRLLQYPCVENGIGSSADTHEIFPVFCCDVLFGEYNPSPSLV